MREPANRSDVIVVGAGVSGLSAALRLARAGLTVTVLESAPWVGGRMSTEKVDGFRLDRIGQLLSTAYPELALSPGLRSLALRPFTPGVLLHSEGRRQRTGAPAGAGGVGGARGALHAVRALAGGPLGRASGLTGGGRGRGGGAADTPVGGARPGDGLSGGAGSLGSSAYPDSPAEKGPGTPLPTRGRPTAPFVSALDQARLRGALARLAGVPVERLLARPEAPAREALYARGLPSRTVDGFLRPLLAALLCDPELRTSSRCADLALRAFAGGRLCVPEGGADALPELLAGLLPEGSVRTGVRVTSVSTTSVTTAEHGVFRCRAILLATDARTAAELLPGLRVPDFHPVTVVHHTADEPPETGAALLLDADRGGPVSHTAVMSDVDPTRAPAGRALISSTVLGVPPRNVDEAVRAHLSRLYGTPTHRWETLAVHHTKEAVPAMRPPHDLHRPVRLLAGLYICGDHRDTSTVQGALHSAHRAATALLADLNTGTAPADPPVRVPKAA